MGVFNWPIRLDSMDGQRSLEIEAMVDTVAGYTIVPANLLRDLGVSPIDKISLVPADGRPAKSAIITGEGDDRTVSNAPTLAKSAVGALLRRRFSTPPPPRFLWAGRLISVAAGGVGASTDAGAPLALGALPFSPADPAATQANTGYDTGNAGLIAVDNLAQLNAMRSDVNSDGVAPSANRKFADVTRWPPDD